MCVCLCIYLEVLIQFVQAALTPNLLFRALRSRHITVEHTGSYDRTSVSGFTSREIHTGSTPQLQHGHAVKYNEITARYNNASLSYYLDKIQWSYWEICTTAKEQSCLRQRKPTIPCNAQYKIVELPSQKHLSHPVVWGRQEQADLHLPAKSKQGTAVWHPNSLTAYMTLWFYNNLSSRLYM